MVGPQPPGVPCAAQHLAAAAVRPPVGRRCAFDPRYEVNFYYHEVTRQRQWRWPASGLYRRCLDAD
eukprot:5518485-Alexandrium_andersonii.AAC.1